MAPQIKKQLRCHHWQLTKSSSLGHIFPGSKWYTCAILFLQIRSLSNWHLWGPELKVWSSPSKQLLVSNLYREERSWENLSSQQNRTGFFEIWRQILNHWATVHVDNLWSKFCPVISCENLVDLALTRFHQEKSQQTQVSFKVPQWHHDQPLLWG